MSLSCECEPRECKYYYFGGDDDDVVDIGRFTTRRECVSCGVALLGKPGYMRNFWGGDLSDGLREHAGAVNCPVFCEGCGGFLLALLALGLCVEEYKTMRADYEEYRHAMQ